MTDDKLPVERRRAGPSNDAKQIPASLPYVALGRRGEYYFYLDALKAFLPLRLADLSRPSVLLSLFAGDPGSIFRLYPKLEKGKDGKLRPKEGSYRQTGALDHAIRLAQEAGIFHPGKQLRGRGGWIDDDQKHGRRLALNRGSKMILGSVRAPLGRYNGFAYMAGSPILELAPQPQWADVLLPAIDWLDRQLATWTWAYPRLAPRLIAGWLALAPLSGALPVRPTLAIAGGFHAGRDQLLAFCQAMLGSWATVVTDATQSALEEADAWDSLATIIEATPGRRIAQTAAHRRPLWAHDIAPPPIEHMRLAPAEAAIALGLTGAIDLALTGAGAGIDADQLLKEAREHAWWLAPADLAARWKRVTETLYPAWRELIEVQEGATRESNILAMLLAGATALRGEPDPTEDDFNALESELTPFMLGQRGERSKPEQIFFDALLGIVIDPFNVTVLQDAVIGAGWGADEPPDQVREDDLVSFGMMSQHHNNFLHSSLSGRAHTETEACEHAQCDPMARRARERIGQLGFKILGNRPGERRFAIAHTTPARTRALERMGLLAQIESHGWTVRNTLMQLAGAERMPGNAWFPGHGTARGITVPLDLVTGRLVGNDPAGIADAMERGSDAKGSDG